jgi:hypothetical protein
MYCHSFLMKKLYNLFIENLIKVYHHTIYVGFDDVNKHAKFLLKLTYIVYSQIWAKYVLVWMIAT